MKPVEFGFLFSHFPRRESIDCMVVWAENIHRRVVSDPNADPFMIRYDNGQLCTFKRKARSTKDNE